MSEQTSLALPEKQPTYTDRKVKVDDVVIGPVIGPEPPRSLIESVRQLGVSVPLLVMEERDLDGNATGKFQVIDGRRRLQAAREVDIRRVPVRIVVSERGAIVAPAMTLASNGHRSSNAASELDAIEDLVRQGADDATIARLTGLRKNTIDTRKKLSKLIPTLRDALNVGTVSVSVLERCASLPESLQSKAATILDETAKLTAAQVSELSQTRRDGVTSMLPAEAFGRRTWYEDAADSLETAMSVVRSQLGEESEAFQAIAVALEKLASAKPEATATEQGGDDGDGSSSSEEARTDEA